MSGFPSFLAAFLIAAGMCCPGALRAECVDIGKTCIGSNDLKAKVRIGNHTPDLQGLIQFTELTDLTLMADLRFKEPVDLSPSPRCQSWKGWPWSTSPRQTLRH
ncbi:hypothetical protein [Leisingera sp. NJS201]|uniref:hypothetical protein n=1 Tax=Leisingera sp. NJS201 TaxID=2508306 RepID=UPI0020C7657B|nr:hypothetical protein [Leisingera sp. NJS201]